MARPSPPGGVADCAACHLQLKYRKIGLEYAVFALATPWGGIAQVVTRVFDTPRFGGGRRRLKSCSVNKALGFGRPPLGRDGL